MSATPTIGVLALQGDVAEHQRVLDGLGARSVPVLRAEQLDRVDGLVVPGGESTTMSKLAVRYDLMEPLRKHVRSGLPAYGTCAGMIMLADRILDGTAGQETIGGIDMTVRRNAFGRQTESFEAAVRIDGVAGDPFDAVFIRAPWVESVGPGVAVLGQVPRGERAGRIVAVRQGSLLATSFHPELTGDARIHRLFVDMVKGHA
ncbi:pyridoxal 5'-phosphate synthase glutaminase subunit PdxT [Marinitenerispora sediminis]|uniref:Pyridoxal 5'-phosphate synthase subunit PdxT n=1 Tax=Marinitenerispora sediminis TaxID=1931232 RepID=A0A368T7Z2_9ACTN|nr:pyridoxal 5'-phosphate synthase glutaminase subunit PdxT [Marinitenerispora sediminis]RCV51032.1 pyridoxal 5'-phosphate synthase glutaminase subunit PdxT [Marinitenerispora sediminis]RCV57025.1 pyridoxal 5'-phosphate synthase glutaminase subunit PdxT [Marinitenerispora sediminis]RCV60011.1 pyridoxal 5'-phosphate synthase glutaminase subunit PdxT [Marinitenerispora sediminis]